MKLQLISVAKGAPAWADDGVQAYAKRLRRFGGLHERTLKPVPFRGDEGAVRDAEAKRILDSLGPHDQLVALDERGEDLSTEGFAELMRVGLEQSRGSLVFALGGPYGHGAEVRANAWRVVRVSSMVLNHQLARMVVVEQMYRAMTLLRGGSYHH